jgi:uncharacterized protein YbbK (DUF523 family)
VKDTKALLATDKNLNKRHGSEDDSPIAHKSKSPNCGNKYYEKCNKDPSTCKGKGHIARFCVNSSSSVPKHQQSNNDDKESEVKHKANLKRRER